jgi:Na+/H+-dicarboxylate symporter
MVPGLIQDYTLHPTLALTPEITPFFQLALTPWLSPDRTMLIAVVIGVFFSLIRVPVVTRTALNLRNAVNNALHYGLIPCLPFYVFGFVLKTHQEGGLVTLFHSYIQVFLLILLLFAVYIFCYYWLGNIFHIRSTLCSLQNMLPAAITGFCTMSSVATMPVTLESTEKNLKTPSFAQLVIPMTANMHLLGDALGLPLMALAIIMMKGFALPSLVAYLPFVLYFCLAKFSTAGIPGGGVLILLPVLERHLGLNSEMLSLITTLYILQDSVFTCANVLGNGAFAILVERITGCLRHSSAMVGKTEL